jgi:hypothetical protein
MAAPEVPPPAPPPTKGPVATTLQVAAEHPPFVPPAPFTIVAQAPGEQDFIVFPLEDGAAALGALVNGKAASSLQLAVIDHDRIASVPSLLAGLPPALFLDQELPSAAGRWPDAVWLARGAPCEVYHWQPKLDRWEPSAPRTATDGKCRNLSPWTAGAAIAIVEGPRGSNLVAFGAAPRTVPALVQPRPDQRKKCQERFALPYEIFGFPTGEVLVDSGGCGRGSITLTRWASGASLGDTVDAEIVSDAPFVLRAATPARIVVDGFSKPGFVEEGPVEVLFDLVSGRLHRVSIQKHERTTFLRWLQEDRQILGLPPVDPPDGFQYDTFVVAPNDDVFVLGHLRRAGKRLTALVLRNRPVEKALVLN